MYSPTGSNRSSEMLKWNDGLPLIVKATPHFLALSNGPLVYVLDVSGLFCCVGGRGSFIFLFFVNFSQFYNGGNCRFYNGGNCRFYNGGNCLVKSDGTCDGTCNSQFSLHKNL